MKRLILLLFSGMALAQTFTVSGHVVNPNTGVPTGAQITFKLINTGTQQCKVSGTGLIVPNNQVFTPDNTGTISGTLYRNDFISCGGSSNTQWSYIITAPGVTMPTCALAAVTTTSLNVDSAACTNTVPVVTPPTGDTTYCRLDGSNCGFTGNVALNGHNITGVGAINKVIYVDQQVGATADVKFSNACTALPATGGVLDARGFGPGNQSIAATVSCGSATQPVTLIFDPSTNFQPSTAALNMFQYSQNNHWYGLHIDTTNQSTYSGNAIQNNASQGIFSASMERISVTMATGGGSTGSCWAYVDTGSTYVIDSDFDITCTNPGTAAAAILFASGGTSFFNANRARFVINNTPGFAVSPKYCVDVQANGGAVGGNQFSLFCEMNFLATALAGVHLGGTFSSGNPLGGNQWAVTIFDIPSGNNGILVDAKNICANQFVGQFLNFAGTAAAVSDSTTCTGNEYRELASFTYLQSGPGSTSRTTTLNGVFTFGTVGGTGSFNLNFPLTLAEQSAPAGIAGKDLCYANSGNHRPHCVNNNGSDDGIVFANLADTLVNKTLTAPAINNPVLNTVSITGTPASANLAATVASGTTTLTSGNIANATCQTAVTTAAVGAATTDAIEWAYATAPSGTTDALLTVSAYVTSGNVNFTRCNTTATNPIASTGIVINWRVVR